jgi:glutathione S-transferase
MYDLHYWPTPNGKKVTILLEELGVPYRIVPVHIGRGDQFTDDFLKISPNNRMPALVDTEPKGGGEPIGVFESGAIMMYLAEKEGRFWPQDTRGKYEVAQWVMWQMANQGPKTGERGHFGRLGPEHGDQSYAQRRFADETHRLYGVLNNRLYDRPLPGRRRLHDRRHDLLSLDGQLEAAGHRPRRVQVLQALVRGALGAARRGEGHGGDDRPAGRGPRHPAAGGTGAPPQAALQPARPPGPGGLT